VKKLWLVFCVCLGLALFAGLSNLQTSTAQTTTTDEVAIIQLTTPTNAVGVNVRSVSNDGKRFVFDSINDYDGSNVDSNREIFVFEVDTKTVIQLTDTKDITQTAEDGTVTTTRRITNNTPIISGDGTKIVFTSNAKLTDTANDEGNQEVYLIDFPRTATTRSQAVITRLTDTGGNNETEVINEIFTNYAPTINDDGSVIAFVSTRRMFRALANGTPAFTAAQEGANGDLAPDGNGEIFLYNATTKRYSQVTITRDTDSIVNFVVRGFNNNPNLSGDGRRLVFLSGFNFPGAAANKNTDFNGELFLHNVGDAANTVRQVTETTGNSAFPVGGVMNVLPAFVRPLNRTGSLLVFESAGDFAGKNSEKLREVFLADLSAATTTFRQVTDQTTVDVTKNDLNYLPSINSPGTFITFGSTLNLTPASTSSVTADNADGSREVFRYNIATAGFRQITFTPTSALTLDQRTQTVPSYADNEGNAINFSLESELIAPNLTINQEAFRAVIFPVTGQNSQAPAIVNAASYDATQVARGSIVAAYGTQLAPSTVMASALPLPVELGGVRVTVAGIAAELIFVSPTQINFVLPNTIGVGDTVPYRINNNGLQASGTIKLVAVAPGVFSATGDGKGKAVAQCGRVSDDGLTFEVSTPPCATSNTNNENLLILYGTGWRNGAGITVKVGDLVLTPSYSGPQPNYPGLDQINVSIPSELANKTDTEFTVEFGTVISNKLTTSFGAFEQGFAVANGASFEGGFIARGSLAVATGEMLANDTADAASMGYPTELLGVKVLIGGKLARLSYISPTQINFILPDDLATADLVAVDILNNGKRLRSRIGVRGAAAGLFTTDGAGNGTVVAKCGKRNADGTTTLSDPPCAVGTTEAPNFLRLIGTGWRFAEKTTDDQTVAPVIVSIGGVDLTPTFAAGQPNGSGGTVRGIDQIDVNLTTDLAGKTGQDVIIKTTDKKGQRLSKAGVTVSFQ